MGVFQVGVKIVIKLKKVGIQILDPPKLDLSGNWTISCPDFKLELVMSCLIESLGLSYHPSSGLVFRCHLNAAHTEVQFFAGSA